MTESELDAAYTELCKAMTALGESQSPLFLARFALLSIIAIGDEPAIQRLIVAARAGMAEPAA